MRWDQFQNGTGPASGTAGYTRGTTSGTITGAGIGGAGSPSSAMFNYFKITYYI